MVGILIPTMNRSDFVIRQMDYYACLRYPGTIYIGDSSDEQHMQNTVSAIKRFEGKLKIIYKHCPGLNIQLSLKQLLEQTTEKYVAFSGDDDFLIPNSLNKCARFLDSHPDYSTCQGVAVLFNLNGDGIYGEIEGLGRYRLLGNEYTTPRERLSQFMDKYWVPQFSVHRTHEFAEDCQDMDTIPLECFREKALSSLAIIRGKSKTLDCLYLLRQAHNRRYANPPLLELLMNPTWQPSFQAFHDILVEALIRHEGMDRDAASETVKKAFWDNFSKGVIKSAPQQNSLRSKVSNYKQRLAGRFPELRNVYLKIKPRLPMFKGEISLHVLLNRSSRYRKDFLPLYNFVTTFGGEK